MSKEKKTRQTFNDGIAKIFSVIDASKSVSKPQLKIRLKYKLRFESRFIGYSRYYAALQANVEIKKIIRVQHRPDITSQDIVILADGYQYRIEQLQAVFEEGIRCDDLSLSLLTSPYEVVAEEEYYA